MKNEIVLNAQLKKSSGSGRSKALRRNGMIPCILYVYDGADNIQFSIQTQEFLHLYNDRSLSSKIIILKFDDFDGKKVEKRVIMKDIQIHAITDIPLHIDFQEIVDGMKVKVAVKIRPTNMDKCPGIKLGGVLTLIKRSIIFNCDPEYIQSHIDIDLANLQIGSSVHIKDLKLTDKLIPVDKTNFPILMIAGRADDAAKDGVAGQQQGGKDKK